MENKYYTMEEILGHNSFPGCVGGLPDTVEDVDELGNFMGLVAVGFKFLPKKIVDEVLKNCIIVYAPAGKAAAAYFHKDTLKDKALIIWYRSIVQCKTGGEIYEFVFRIFA